MESKENQREQDGWKREEVGKKQENAGKGTGLKKAVGLIGISGIFLICLVIGFFVVKGLKSFEGFISVEEAVSDVFVGEEGKVTTISKVSLEKVFEISELATSQYTYNAVARAYEEDGISVRYYVAYEGRVTAGIDFSKLEYDIDQEQKIITVVIPEIEFQEKTVNPGTLKYIFKDSKSETETVHQEAFRLCEKDLEERIEQENALREQARQNTIAVVQGLVEPWVRQIDRDYKVVIR